MGMREFVCYYSEPTNTPPTNESLDIGIMLYDVFDLNKYAVTPKAEPFVSLFHAKLENGILEVPPYDSELVLKPEGGK